MKTLLIFILAAALAAGAALSRPSEADFKAYYRQQAQQQSKGGLQRLFLGSSIDSYLSHCTYKNRLLWADVERDGQTVYTGAFSHWFSRGQPAK